MSQEPPIRTVHKAETLVLDATWNHRQWCLLVYRDKGGTVLSHRFDQGERFEGYLQDLVQIRATGYIPKAIVSDGKAGLLKAVNKVYPEVPQQRCLIHIHRQALNWLTQHPKTLAGQALRQITLELFKVQTIEDAQTWNLLLESWFELFQEVLQEKTVAAKSTAAKQKKWWYTHKSLRKTWRLLKNSQPHLWLWLVQPDVPRTTNLLEGGVNAPIKRLLHRHSGLLPERQKQVIRWWIYFTNLNQKSPPYVV